MSSEATGWAWKQKGLTPCARLVLLSLCEFANRDFECWPSQSRIAADIEIPRETVNRLIKQLIEKGLVEGKPQNENGVKLVSRYFIRCDLTSHGGSDLRSHRAPISDVTSDHNNNLPLELERKEKEETLLQSVKKEEKADEFATWYAGYPHKVAKGHARTAFKTARRKASLETLIEGVERYIATKPPEHAWCNPGTWLTRERWLDQPGDAPQNYHETPLGNLWKGAHRAAEAIIARQNQGNLGNRDAPAFPLLDGGRTRSDSPDAA